MKDKKIDIFGQQMFFRQLKPAAASAVTLAIGEVIDSIVVGAKLGMVGLAAMSIIMPIFMIFNVIMVGLGLGASISFSKLMASGETDKARSSYKGTVIFTLLAGVFIAAIFNIFAPQFLYVLGVKNNMSGLYFVSIGAYRMLTAGAPIIMLSFVVNYFMRNDDMEVFAGIGFSIGNISDFALSLLFVLVLDMGALGAELATVLGQFIALCIYGFFILTKSENLKLKGIKPIYSGIISDLKVGFSSSVQYILSFVFILIANNVLMNSQGIDGVGIFTIIQNISYVFDTWYDAIVQSSQPVITTFTGECNYKSREEVLSTEQFTGVISGGFIALIICIFASTVCKIFGMTNVDTINLAKPAIYIYCISSLLSGYNQIIAGYEMCFREKISYISSLLRKGIILVPSLLLFSIFAGKFIWLFYLFTEILSLIIIDKFRKKIPDPSITVPEDRIFRRLIRGKDDMPGCLEGIENFCEMFGVSMKQQYFASMAVEELCSAIIDKNFSGGRGIIQLTVIADNSGDFTMYIRDNAVEKNLMSVRYTLKDAKEDEETDFNALGLNVIKQKAKDYSYRRYQGFNTTMIKI